MHHSNENYRQYLSEGDEAGWTPSPVTKRGGYDNNVTPPAAQPQYNARGGINPNFNGLGPKTPGKDTSTPVRLTGNSPSDFESKRVQCLRKRTLFEDPDFLASDSSLYYSRDPPYRFEWKRPSEIAAQHGLRPTFFLDGASRFDVRQGNLGDCWVLSAIASLTGLEHQELFQRVVPPDQSFQDGWYAGMFRFQFWQYGKWSEVIVDDRLPTYRGSLKFVQSGRPNEFWPALLEKAYAKLFGSYEALKAGVAADSLTDFSGGVTETYKLRDPKTPVPRNIINILFKSLERQSLICSGIQVPEGGAAEQKLANGLVTGHSYSITDLREILLMSDRGQIPITLIRVRNPWGSKVEWKGTWGDRSVEWNSIPPQERERMGLIFRDDGEFWMDFQDFLENFDTVDICSLTPDSPVDMPKTWYISEHHGRWQRGFSAGGRPTSESHWSNPQYLVVLQDGDEDNDSVCSFVVQLMQKDRRKMRQRGQKYHFIGFVIYKLAHGYSFPLKKDFFEYNSVVEGVDTFINTRQVIKRFSLSPGEYVVVPCTYEDGQEADFYLRLFFERGNTASVSDNVPDDSEVSVPKLVEQEKEVVLKKYFYKISGENMEVDAFELKKALNDILKTEPGHIDISTDACKLMVSLMDVDNSLKLGYTEFLFLWNHIRVWRRTFYQCDVDNSGKLKSHELRTAIAITGYKLNNGILQALSQRYSNEQYLIDFDSFLMCMAKIMKLFSVFKKHQQNGQAVFSLDEFLEQSLLM